CWAGAARAGDGAAHGEGRVGGATRIDGGTCRDDAPTLEKIPRLSHGEQRHQPLPGRCCGTRTPRPLSRQPAHGPLPARRVTAPYQPVGAGVIPDVLDHPAELLRPEVRDRVVRLIPAEAV